MDDASVSFFSFVQTNICIYIFNIPDTSKYINFHSTVEKIPTQTKPQNHQMTENHQPTEFHWQNFYVLN